MYLTFSGCQFQKEQFDENNWRNRLTKNNRRNKLAKTFDENRWRNKLTKTTDENSWRIKLAKTIDENNCRKQVTKTSDKKLIILGSSTKTSSPRAAGFVKKKASHGHTYNAKRGVRTTRAQQHTSPGRHYKDRSDFTFMSQRSFHFRPRIALLVWTAHNVPRAHITTIIRVPYSLKYQVYSYHMGVIT